MAARLRRMGYRDAMAAPEYCIAGLGEDGFYTKTISVYAGERHQKVRRRPLSQAIKSLARLVSK